MQPIKQFPDTWNLTEDFAVAGSYDLSATDDEAAEAPQQSYCCHTVCPFDDRNQLRLLYVGGGLPGYPKLEKS